MDFLSLTISEWANDRHSGFLMTTLIGIILTIFVVYKNRLPNDHGYFLIAAIVISYFCSFWRGQEGIHLSLHVLCSYPILVLLKLAFSKRKELLSIPTLWIGSFCNIAIIDIIKTIEIAESFQQFNGIGGKGLTDALFITPLIACLFGAIINLLMNSRQPEQKVIVAA